MYSNYGLLEGFRTEGNTSQCPEPMKRYMSLHHAVKDAALQPKTLNIMKTSSKSFFFFAWL